MIIKKLWPSLISIWRIPLGAAVYYYAIHDHWTIAFLLLVSAEITDGLDGWVANKLNACTPLGGYFDAVCDFCMTSGAVAGLVLTHTISWITVGLLIGYVLVIYGVVVYGNVTGKKNRFFWFCDGVNPFAGIILGVIFTLIYLIKTDEPILWISSAIVAAILVVYLPYKKSHRINEWWGKLQKAFPKSSSQ